MTAPAFLNDLYRDLRDRRLLPVVIALGVAILAVPVVLKSSAEAPPPLAPAALDVSDAAPPPAVFVGEEGIRDYRERLKLLSSTNPFEAKFAPEPVDESVGLQDISVSDTDGLTSVTTEEPTSTSTSTSGSTSSGVSTGSSTSASPPSGDGSSGSGSDEEDEITFFTYRVDLEIGPKGDLEAREGLKRMTVLPGPANPVAIFLGVTESAKRAIFTLSTDVAGTSGDGSCLPSAGECSYLTLKEGDSREIVYQPDGEAAVTYVLTLGSIDVVEVKDPRKKETKTAKRAHRASSPDSGGAAFLARGG